ncbi:Holliday junction branch migration DNA helicase RuvB [Candidatus Gracilibacteria bacterium]|nr:Holliday junction branch migration DNA helicase RuvB [Candidatus Gracilibacteria bacterium]
MAVKKFSDLNQKNLTSVKNISKDEEIQEISLRPSYFDDYVGQSSIKEKLKIFIEAAKQRGESLQHILFYGAPGLGKTSISNVIAKEMGSNIKIMSGPTITKAGDLAAILTSIKKGDILFIDEIHRMKTNIEEILYSAMEDFKIDIIMGKGPGARSMRLDVPKFTLIGATTKAGSLSAPLRDRFGIIEKLDFYTISEMKKIISRSAKILQLKIDDEALEDIALCSRFTPRIANRLLKSLRDFAQVQNENFLDIKTTISGLKSLGVDETGLDKNDEFFLRTILEKFDGGPVGLNTLAIAMNEDKETIEDIHEPFLIQKGYIKRTQKGRILTQKSLDFLKNKKINEDNRKIF